MEIEFTVDPMDNLKGRIPKRRPVPHESDPKRWRSLNVAPGQQNRVMSIWPSASDNNNNNNNTSTEPSNRWDGQIRDPYRSSLSNNVVVKHEDSYSDKPADNSYSHRQHVQTTELHVSGLDVGVSPNALRDLFSHAGTVKDVSLPGWEHNHRNRGFGFVKLETVEESSVIVQQLDGIMLQGQQIRVRENRSTESTSTSAVQSNPSRVHSNGSEATLSRGGDIHDSNEDRSSEQETESISKMGEEQNASLPVTFESWEQKSPQEKMQLLLPDEDIFRRLIVVEFSEDWDIRCKRATERTLERVRSDWDRNQREQIESGMGSNQNEYLEWDEGYEPDSIDMGSTNKTLRELPRQCVHFIQNLMNCIALHFGFHVFALESGHRRTCYCPCSKKMEIWRKQFGLEEIPQCTGTGSFLDFALLSHLKQRNLDLYDRCLDYHQITRMYLQHVYEDYLDKNLAHKSLYDKDGKDYLRAEAAQNRSIKIQIDDLRTEIQHYKREKEKLLKDIEEMKTVNPEKAVQLEEAVNAKDALIKEWSVPLKPPTEEYSEDQLNCFLNIADSWFSTFHYKKKGGKKAPKLTLNLSQDFNFVSLVEKQLINKENGDLDNCQLILEGEERTLDWVRGQLEVNFKVSSELKLRRKTKEEKAFYDNLEAKDKGGPSRSFLSKVWEHATKIMLPSNENGKKDVFLFEAVGKLWPVQDDYLIGHFGSEEKAKKFVQPICRALGRLMLHVIACEYENGRVYTIAGHLMPSLYKRFLLQDIRPTDPRYHVQDVLSDVVDHICAGKSEKELKDYDVRTSVMAMIDLYCYGDADDSTKKEYNKETFLKAAEAKYIQSCSIILDSLKDGLGYNVKDQKKPLDVFKMMPFPAIDPLFFAKHRVAAQDVIFILKPLYDEKASKIKKTAQQYLCYQKMIISEQEDGDPEKMKGLLVDFLLKKESEDEQFPANFLELVTGCRYLPQYGTSVVIEFNSVEFNSEDSLPVCHTCECTLKMPSYAYRGDADLFEARLMQTYEYCGKGFDMT